MEADIQVNDRIVTSNETIKIDFKHSVKALLNVFTIVDGEYSVAIAPALNLSGYGKTDEGATEMLKEVIIDYFESLMNLQPYQALKELEKYGWEKQWFSKKKFENRAFIDEYGVLKNLELPENTPVKKSTLQVA